MEQISKDNVAKQQWSKGAKRKDVYGGLGTQGQVQQANVQEVQAQEVQEVQVQWPQESISRMSRNCIQAISFNSFWQRPDRQRTGTFTGE